MNRESDILLSEIYEYLGLNNVKKYVLIGAIGAPLLFGLVFLLLRYGSLSHAGEPLSIGTRIGGSFIITAGFLLLWLISFKRTINRRNYIKKQWSTEEEQDKLIDNFKKSVSVFQGTVKIGKDYTFIAREGVYVNTKQILSIYPKKERYSTTIIVAYKDPEDLLFPKELSVFGCSDNKEGRAEADRLIQEAIDVLKTVRQPAQA